MEYELEDLLSVRRKESVIYQIRVSKLLLTNLIVHVNPFLSDKRMTLPFITRLFWVSLLPRKILPLSDFCYKNVYVERDVTNTYITINIFFWKKEVMK